MQSGGGCGQCCRRYMHVEFGREHSCDPGCDWLFGFTSVHTAAFAAQGIISLVAHDDPGDNCAGSPFCLIQIAGQFSDCVEEDIGKRLLFNLDRSCFGLASKSRRYCRRIDSVIKVRTGLLLCYRVQSHCRPSGCC